MRICESFSEGVFQVGSAQGRNKCWVNHKTTGMVGTLRVKCNEVRQKPKYTYC